MSNRLEAGTLRVSIFDVAGRQVRSLEKAVVPGGDHVLTWDGRDDRGRPVGSGVFFARGTASGRSETIRVVRLH